jgi:hypothetical protein
MPYVFVADLRRLEISDPNQRRQLIAILEDALAKEHEDVSTLIVTGLLEGIQTRDDLNAWLAGTASPRLREEWVAMYRFWHGRDP